MPNHFHLLLEVSRAPLAKVMQSLLYRYTRHYNQRYRKVGHLFQGRYRAILCDRDNYLMELIRYLHLNPVRARMVREPSLYRWSSHRDYLGGKSERITGIGVRSLLLTVISFFYRNGSWPGLYGSNTTARSITSPPGVTNESRSLGTMEIVRCSFGYYPKSQSGLTGSATPTA
jgi:hypothetical protein